MEAQIYQRRTTHRGRVDLQWAGEVEPLHRPALEASEVVTQIVEEAFVRRRAGLFDWKQRQVHPMPAVFGIEEARP